MGAVETWEHAKECAAHCSEPTDNISMASLCPCPISGMRRASLTRSSYPNCTCPFWCRPIPDDLDQFSVERRRDAFCGKISVCNNLRQYGYPYTLTDAPHGSSRSRELQVRSRHLCSRLPCGQVPQKSATRGLWELGPNAFNTVRYSEKILQAYGISVSTIDLSEMFGAANELDGGDPRVEDRLNAIKAYIETLLERLRPRSPRWPSWRWSWMIGWPDKDLDATAVQCWDAIQKNYGVNACTVMSMMSDKADAQRLRGRCHGRSLDVQPPVGIGQAQCIWWTGTITMRTTLDKCVLFHCGNWAKSLLGRQRGPDKNGQCRDTGHHLGHRAHLWRRGRPRSRRTYDLWPGEHGRHEWHRALLRGRRLLHADPLQTFGSRAVVEIPGLQTLLQHICKNGFEHHVAMSASRSADVLCEAWSTYMGWNVLSSPGIPRKNAAPTKPQIGC